MSETKETQKEKPKTREQLFTEAVVNTSKRTYAEIYDELLKAKKARDKLNPSIRNLNEQIEICEQALKVRRKEDGLE